MNNDQSNEPQGMTNPVELELQQALRDAVPGSRIEGMLNACGIGEPGGSRYGRRFNGYAFHGVTADEEPMVGMTIEEPTSLRFRLTPAQAIEIGNDLVRFGRACLPGPVKGSSAPSHKVASTETHENESGWTVTYRTYEDEA